MRAAIQSVTTKTSRPVDLQACSCGDTLEKNCSLSLTSPLR
jgi:hypothetical protein